METPLPPAPADEHQPTDLNKDAADHTADNSEPTAEQADHDATAAEQEAAASEEKNDQESADQSTASAKDGIDDTVRKITEAALSLIQVARNRAEKAVNELVEKGKVKLAPDKRKELVDDIFEETEKVRENIETRLRDIGGKVKTRLDFATRDEVKKLKKRIKKLEKQLDKKTNNKKAKRNATDDENDLND